MLVWSPGAERAAAAATRAQKAVWKTIGEKAVATSLNEPCLVWRSSRCLVLESASGVRAKIGRSPKTPTLQVAARGAPGVNEDDGVSMKILNEDDGRHYVHCNSAIIVQISCKQQT